MFVLHIKFGTSIDSMRTEHSVYALLYIKSKTGSQSVSATVARESKSERSKRKR